MAEDIDFDIETGIMLLPVLDGTEATVHRLINAIEFYATILNEKGRKTLCFFVLKTRIPRAASSQLKQKYDSCDSLIDDLKKYFIVPKDVIALVTQLNMAKQGNGSIAEFGNRLEKLVSDIAIVEGKGDRNIERIIFDTYEQLAIHVFKRGLKNLRLQTIILIWKFSSLKEAIARAIEEETVIKYIFLENRSYNRYKYGSNARDIPW